MSRGRQIGRLKLKPLTPEVRIKYLLDWSTLELLRNPTQFVALTSEDLFGNSHPLEIEIGAGSGEYLCDLASKNPQGNFLGIEVSLRAAHMAVTRAAAAQLANLRILRTDFKMLGALLKPVSWQAAYLHFPDPPLKRKDAKHTIFDRAFLDTMAKVLVPGGILSVVSDKDDYFDAMLALAESDPRFVKTHAEPFLPFEPEVKSRFQRSWESKGLKPRRFVLRKAS